MCSVSYLKGSYKYIQQIRIIIIIIIYKYQYSVVGLLLNVCICYLKFPYLISLIGSSVRFTEQTYSGEEGGVVEVCLMLSNQLDMETSVTLLISNSVTGYDDAESEFHYCMNNSLPI